MISTIKTRINKRAAAIFLTFGLLLTGSGLASLASLNDTLTDTVEFGTLSVDLKDGASDSSQVQFQNINPAVNGSFSQDIDLNNSGSASATVDLTTVVTTGANSDLDAALVSAVHDGTCASPGAAIVITPGPYRPIADVDTNFPTISLNANAHRALCIKWELTANPAMVTDTLIAEYQFVATHP